MYELFLTGLEQDIIKSSNPIYLGDWVCTTLSSKNIANKKIRIIDNHWNDIEKLFKDYDYLKKIHRNTLLELSKVLNNMHRCSYSTKFWQTIIDPWLLSYIAVVFDRWETISKASDIGARLKVYSPIEKYKHEISRTTQDFTNIYDSNSWNHNLFIEIIENQSNKDLFNINYLNNFPKIKIIKSKSNFISLSDFKDKIKFIFNKLTFLTEHFSSPPKIYLDLKYSGRFARRDINLGLNQNPFYQLYFLLEKEKNSKKYIYNNKISRIKGINIGDSNFEKFLTKRICKDIPTFLVEEFSKHFNLANKFYKPKLIVSDNSHTNNLIFKFWLAICQENKASVILATHGGSLSQSSINLMDYEESISDNFITWTKPIQNKHVQLPPLKYYKTRKKVKVNSNKFISIVGVDNEKYTCRCQVGPKSGQIWLHHNQIIKFYKSLENRFQNITRIRPYSDSGRGLSQIYQQEFGKENVSSLGSFENYIDKSSLVICTYPHTTFSDCISRNIPAILIYPDSLWQIHPKMKTLYDILFDAKLIFHDPNKLANFVNYIFLDLESWWNSTTVRNVIKIYESQACNISKNISEEWINFIRSKSFNL